MNSIHTKPTNKRRFFLLTLITRVVVCCAILLSTLPVRSQKATTLPKAPFTLVKKWSLSGLDRVESVAYDSTEGVLYVSSMNDLKQPVENDGYISKFTTEGQLIKKYWMTGLKSPTGLVISKGMLYASDFDRVVAINLKEQVIEQTYKAPGITFLDDIAADENGDVYVGNLYFGPNVIYRISNGKMEEWVNDDRLEGPDGILPIGDYVYVGTWGKGLNPKILSVTTPGRLVRIHKQTKVIEEVTPRIGTIDGLQSYMDGFFMTNWTDGKILYYANSTKAVYDILQVEKGPADILVLPERKLMFVPQMMNDRVDIYQIVEQK